MKYVCKVCANIVEDEPPKICPICKMEDMYISVVGTMFDDNPPQETAKEVSVKNIPEEDLEIIKQISDDEEFIRAMDDLKKNDIIEYQARMSQFRNQIEQKTESQPE